MQSVRERVHGRRSARSRREEVRRVGGEHDRDAPLRERISLESSGKTGRQPGDPTSGGYAMPDHGGNHGPAPTGPGGTEAAGGARGSGAQRRYFHAGGRKGVV